MHPEMSVMTLREDRKRKHHCVVDHDDLERRIVDQLVELCKGQSLSFQRLQKLIQALPSFDLVTRQCTLFDNKKNLLDYVCDNKLVTLEIVRYLVELFPHFVQQRSQQQQQYWKKGTTATTLRLPLHRACLNRFCPTSVVEFLLEKEPNAIRIPSPKNDGLPLHCLLLVHKRQLLPYRSTQLTMAIINDGRDEIYKGDDDDDDDGCPCRYYHRPLDLRLVKRMVDMYPEALTNRYNQACKTPLLLACDRMDISIELVKLLTDKEFDVLTSPMGFYYSKIDLPLQAIFGPIQSNPPPIRVVKFLLEHTKPNEYIVTAFHMACQSKYITKEIVQLFLNRHNHLINLKDENGNTPFVSICRNANLNMSIQVDIIHFLMETYPNTTILTNNEFGINPLSIVAPTSLGVVKYLVTKYPKSLKEVDFGGNLPFHFHCWKGTIETVKFLYELYPESIRRQNEFGELPLYYAIKNGKMDVVHFLIKHYPDGVKVPCSFNSNLPLHSVCQSPIKDLSLIKILYDVYPYAIQRKNTSGCLPLHILCDRALPPNGDDDVIRFVARQYPDALQIQDKEGRTPLHYLLSHPLNDLVKCRRMIELNRDAVRVKSGRHGLPIHIACKNELSLDVIKYLESIYPESINMKHNNFLPLNWATNKDVFNYLILKRYKYHNLLQNLFEDPNIYGKCKIAKRILKYYPDVARHIDEHGRYPFHVAIRKHPMYECTFLRELLKLNPNAIKTQDTFGSLPLHYALRNIDSRRQRNLIKNWLLDAYPESINIVDNEGCTPLHVACQYCPLIVPLLIKKNPNSIHIRDCNGRIPLHVVCEYGASKTIMEYLIQSDEMTMGVKDKDGELPLHKACYGGHITIVNYLMEKNLPSINVRNSLGELPIFLLSQVSKNKNVNAMDSTKYLEAIWKMLLANPAEVCKID